MNSAPASLHSPLHDWHTAHGARMVEFAGWSMPMWYASIVAEHQATRNGCGLFDVSHMGRLSFAGDEAEQLMEYVLTNSVASMRVGQVRYNLVCNEHGGILDDVLLYRGDQAWMLVVNASNRQRIWHHLHECADDLGLSNGYVDAIDRTTETAMIAAQGPRAVEYCSTLTSEAIAELPYYSATWAECLGELCCVSRTGYTGEDGFELVFPRASATKFWDALIAQGATPCGLGARDTLRLEAAMPLYGHELNETINPYQAGLSWAVKLDKGQFIGCDALARFKADPTLAKRIGLQLAGKRVPREGCPIWRDGKLVGSVTSGTFSPTLNLPIAMAYVSPAAATVGGELQIDIRGKVEPATVVALPFYKRKK